MFTFGFFGISNDVYEIAWRKKNVSNKEKCKMIEKPGFDVTFGMTAKNLLK